MSTEVRGLRRRLMYLSVNTLITVRRDRIGRRPRFKHFFINVTGARVGLINGVQALGPKANRVLRLIVSFRDVRLTSFLRSLDRASNTMTARNSRLGGVLKTGRLGRRLRWSTLSIPAHRASIGNVGVNNAMRTVRMVSL